MEGSVAQLSTASEQDPQKSSNLRAIYHLARLVPAKNASQHVGLDLARLAEPFSREDGSLLQGDIGGGGVAISLLDQQPGVFPQAGLPDQRKLSP